MTEIASRRIAALRNQFRQFEHGGQCFDTDAIMGIVRELAAIGAAVAVLEQKPAARQAPLPPPPPAVRFSPKGALEVGTFFFVPAGAAAERHV